MMRVLENTGIMGNDVMDRLRQDAIACHHDTPLPAAIVHYLRALEQDYADRRHQDRLKNMREIGWRLSPAGADGGEGAA